MYDLFILFLLGNLASNRLEGYFQNNPIKTLFSTKKGAKVITYLLGPQVTHSSDARLCINLNLKRTRQNANQPLMLNAPLNSPLCPAAA